VINVAREFICSSFIKLYFITTAFILLPYTAGADILMYKLLALCYVDHTSNLGIWLVKIVKISEFIAIPSCQRPRRRTHNKVCDVRERNLINGCMAIIYLPMGPKCQLKCLAIFN